MGWFRRVKVEGVGGRSGWKGTEGRRKEEREEGME